MLNTAYCVRCEKVVPITHPRSGTAKNGSPFTRGVCARCGFVVVRMGKD